MVDAPVRISTPGHSTSGADGVGECSWVTPGVAPEKKLANRLANEGELSDDSTLEARRKERKPVASPARGWVKLYVEHVLQANRGVDFDFLVGSSGAGVPRDSH